MNLFKQAWSLFYKFLLLLKWLKNPYSPMQQWNPKQKTLQISFAALSIDIVDLFTRQKKKLNGYRK